MKCNCPVHNCPNKALGTTNFMGAVETWCKECKSEADKQYYIGQIEANNG